MRVCNIIYIYNTCIQLVYYIPGKGSYYLYHWYTLVSHKRKPDEKQRDALGDYIAYTPCAVSVHLGTAANKVHLVAKLYYYARRQESLKDTIYRRLVAPILIISRSRFPLQLTDN